MKKFLPVLSMALGLAMGPMLFIQKATAAAPTYSLPSPKLYFGLDSAASQAPYPVLVYPAFTPLTFLNARNGSDWTYDDTSGSGNTATGPTLTVTYGLKPFESGTPYYNWYGFPTLTGDEGSYTPEGYLQAGGGGEYDGKRYGLTVADPVTEGVTTYTVDGLPIFGYNDKVDEYWSLYSFNDYYDELDHATNWCHLLKYADFFYSPETPIVIEGMHSLAYGKIREGAEFYADIYSLNRAYEVGEEPDFTAPCTDIQVSPVEGSDLDLISMTFRFDEPVVLSSDYCPYFVAAVGGFNDPEHVDYFNPLMSEKSSPSGLGLGWVCKRMLWSEMDYDKFSWSSVTGYITPKVSFYIMLDAAYPWLITEENEVSINSLSTAELKLNSYYPGDQLSIIGMPEWLSATARGRFGDTVVEFYANEDAVSNEEVNVKIEAPTLSQTVRIKLDASGVNGIGIEEEVATEWYTLDGRRVSGMPLQPGIYIDGKGRKHIIK